MSTREHRSHNSRSGHRFHANDSGPPAAQEIARLLETTQQTLHTWQSIADELRQLGQRQFVQGIEAAKAVSNCGDPNRAYKLQMAYWRGATENYAQAAQACMSLAAHGMTDGYAGLMKAPFQALGTWDNWLNTDGEHTAPPPAAAA